MMFCNPTDNGAATILLVRKLQIRNKLWFLEGVKRLKNIYNTNVINDLEHQQMCRPKKEKSCTIDVKTINKKHKYKQYQNHTNMEQ
jgi:hypothetical protein